MKDRDKKQRELLASQIEEATQKLKTITAEMLDKADEESAKKYENMMKFINKLQDQIDDIDLQEAEQKALEEKEKNKGRIPESLTDEDRKKKYVEECEKFVKGLRESVAKGSTFSGSLPTDVASQIQMKKESLSELRKYCHVTNVTGDYVFMVEGDYATVTYVDEGAKIGETSPSLTPLKLSPLKIGGLIKVTNEYLSDLGVDVMAYLIDSLGRAFARAEDHEILFGTGESSSGNHINGICNCTNKIVAAAVNTITWTEVKELISALGDYRPSARLIMSQATLDIIQEFKDGDGRYLFSQTEDLTRIKGIPITICSQMPTLAAGQAAILAGDFYYYKICDRAAMKIVTLNELYAETDQTGIRGIERTDGDFIDAAFASLYTAEASA